MSERIPKYQYHVMTWGGFYNEEYRKIHGFKGGDYFFDTESERQRFIDTRKRVSRSLGIPWVCFDLNEGFTCDTRTVLHRVCEIDGKQYYDTYDLGVNYPFHTAVYHMENKWYPGFNHYPAGEDVDYDKADVKIVSEWVTGAMVVGGEGGADDE